MLIDKELEFSDSQAITATAASTNVIDLSALSDHAIGNAVRVYCAVEAAFTAGGSGTLATTLEVSTDNSTWVVLHTTGAVGKAALIKGKRLIDMQLPAAAAGAWRYVRLNYTVASGPMTAGKVNAALVVNTKLGV